MEKAPIRKITFIVAWNGRKETFQIRDGDGYLLSQSPNHKAAIAQAIKDAMLVHNTGARVSVLSKRPNGAMSLEWHSPT